MRLFIYEVVSGGGLGSDPPESLRREGMTMLRAAASDFCRVQGIHVGTLLDDRHAEPIGHECRRKQSHLPFDDFHGCVVQADTVLVIAPEYQDLLANLSRTVLRAGRHLLGCLPDAVDVAGDKLATARHWQGRHVPTPAVEAATSAPPESMPPPWVCKPRHGAGSQATYLARDDAEWSAAFAQACAEWPANDLIAQSHVSGLPASVGFLVGPHQCLPLLPTRQKLSDEGRFRYLGGHMPLGKRLADRAVRLAQSAIGGIDGLQGYVGVDLVLGDAEEGHRDYVIEINPRLTTSYAGLVHLCREPLGLAWCNILRGLPAELTWQAGPIELDATGVVR